MLRQKRTTNIKIEAEDCPNLGDCEKLEDIRTLDPEKYDISGLIGDICWLCDKSPGANSNCTVLYVRCAWCKPPRIFGAKDGEGTVGATDGICPECRQKYFPGTLEGKEDES